jgi:hypothetical protein
MNQAMEQVIELAVVIFAALATGGLMVNWVGLGRRNVSPLGFDLC